VGDRWQTDAKGLALMRFEWRHVLYRFFDNSGALLYVGRTNSIATRFDDHARKQP
jgi:hypothetical protein